MIRQEFRFIKRTLYDMKHRFGVKGSLYRVTVNSPDRITGATGTTLASIDIKRIVKLPEVSADKFRTGGFFQFGDIELLIDAGDLPSGFVIGPEDYIVIDGKHYNLVTITAFSDNLGWYLQARWTQQTLTTQIANVVNKMFMSFSQVITGEKA